MQFYYLLLVLLLCNEVIYAIHDLRHKVDDPVDGIACRGRDIYHPDGTFLDNEETNGLDLHAGGVSAAVGSCLAGLLAVELNSAAAEA